MERRTHFLGNWSPWGDVWRCTTFKAHAWRVRFERPVHRPKCDDCSYIGAAKVSERAERTTPFVFVKLACTTNLQSNLRL